MNLVTDTKPVTKNLKSQKHSLRSESVDDPLVETTMTAGSTQTLGQAVPASAASSRRERRPNRCTPVNEIDLVTPYGDELDKLVDKFPAPPEWADE